LQNPTLGQYYSSIVQADDGGNSSYNGLLTSVQHRFANHFTLLSNLAWPHCINDQDFTGELQDRPDLILPNQVIPSQQTVKEWFNPAAFGVQAAGAFGNSGRFNVSAPGSWNIDLGVTRTFSIREALSPGKPYRDVPHPESWKLGWADGLQHRQYLRPDHQL
jgi:hypothetical protein